MNNAQYTNLIRLINFYLVMGKSEDEFTRSLAVKKLRELRKDLVQVIEIKEEKTEILRNIA